MHDFKLFLKNECSKSHTSLSLTDKSPNKIWGFQGYKILPVLFHSTKKSGPIRIYKTAYSGKIAERITTIHWQD